MMILGVLLLGLTAATLHRPPEKYNLFDLGPFAATYMFVLAVRFITLARREPEPEEFPKD